MMGFNPTKVILEFLTFKGFSKASGKDRLQWIIRYPILLIYCVFILIANGIFSVSEFIQKKKN